MVRDSPFIHKVNHPLKIAVRRFALYVVPFMLFATACFYVAGEGVWLYHNRDETGSHKILLAGGILWAISQLIHMIIVPYAG
jgi:hypothetical protein